MTWRERIARAQERQRKDTWVMRFARYWRASRDDDWWPLTRDDVDGAGSTSTCFAAELCDTYGLDHIQAWRSPLFTLGSELHRRLVTTRTPNTAVDDIMDEMEDLALRLKRGEA